MGKWGQVLSFSLVYDSLPHVQTLTHRVCRWLVSRDLLWGREAICLAAEDSHLIAGLPSEVVQDFNWAVRAYCLMDNHYHLLIETPDGNLSRACSN